MKTALLLVLVAATQICIGGEANAPVPDYWTTGKPGHPPAGLEVSLIADKTNYFLGENILLHYRIHNASTNSFNISVGGDYRGSTRADRFKVMAGVRRRQTCRRSDALDAQLWRWTDAQWRNQTGRRLV